MKLYVFLFSVICFIPHLALSQDIACSSGDQEEEVTLYYGDSYAFYTTGDFYENNMHCTGFYTLGSDCIGVEVNCPEFGLNSCNSECTRGDYLSIFSEDADVDERFCKRAGPSYFYIDADFSLEFLSNDIRRGGGFYCTVSCEYGANGTWEPTETTEPGEVVTSDIADCKCGLAQRAKRIVGGTTTEVNEYPWQVGLVDVGSDFVWCGGALISDQWILTAAHCVYGTNFEVLLGEHDYETTGESDRVRGQIALAINHPDYNADTLDYDFSLIKLKKPIDFSQHSHIRPICLPEGNSETYDNLAAIVTGWGTIESGGALSSELQEVMVEVLSNTECKADRGYPSSEITDQMLCAGVEEGGKDSCQGDSGGPLVTSGSGDGVTPGQNYEHIGVVSWGYGCAVDRYPGVYARTTMQLDWIYSTTESSFNTCPRI